jgi:hypothetical protein
MWCLFPSPSLANAVLACLVLEKGPRMQNFTTEKLTWPSHAVCGNTVPLLMDSMQKETETIHEETEKKTVIALRLA